MGRRAEALATGVLLLGAMAALAAHCAFLQVPLVDDAAISLAYGLSLFHGDGFRLTHSSQVVEAFSSPLWTFLLGWCVPLRADPVRFASMLGTVLGVAAIGVTGAWGPVAARRLPRLEDAAGGWLAALCTSYAYWTASGMETGLFALLLGASGVLILRARARGAGVPAGVALGLLCLTRPEGVLYAGLAGLVCLVHRHQDGARRAELRGVAAFAAVTGGYELFRLVTFADLLPNTYYAKSTQDFGIASYLGGFASAYPALTCAALGMVVAALLPGPLRRAALIGLGFLLAAVGFVVRFKGDWMREWRFLAPAVPLLGAGLSLGLAQLRSRFERSAPGWLPPLLVAGVMALWVGAEVPVLQTRAPQLKRAPELPMEQIAGIARALDGHIRTIGMRRPLVAFPDIGGLGLTLPDAEVLDTGILADYAMGRHRLNYPAAEDYLVNEGMPAYVDVHGPSGYVENYHRLMGHYAPAWQVAPQARLPGFVWILRGLTPSEDPRCPGGRAAVEAMSRAQLQDRLSALVEGAQPMPALALWRCAFDYLPEPQLPSRGWRAQLAELAQDRALEAFDRRQLSTALRFQSLAAVLDNGTPQRRRLAERFRSELFPIGPVPAPR